MIQQPNAEDLAAARRILHQLPESSVPTTVSRGAGRDGLGSWEVESSKDSDKLYSVELRTDSKNGGTYFFCNCPAWVNQFGKGRDCRHIQLVRCQLSAMSQL